MRVVSLVPSVTETLVGWGVAPVACTRFCEQESIRTVGGTKNPDLEAIVAMAPDLVVVDEEENRRPDYDHLVEAGLPVHVLAIRSVEDVAAQLPVLAERVGAQWDPPLLPSLPRIRLRAMVVIWRRPFMVLGPGTYGASVLARLGVVVAAPGDGEDGDSRYPTVESAELADLAAASGADVILAPTEPYRFAPRHRSELAGLSGGLRVVEVDGKDLFWWGVRTEPALGRLAEMMASLPARP